MLENPDVHAGPLRHVLPRPATASLQGLPHATSPASFSAEQRSFPARHSIKHSRLGGPFSIKNAIKFSVGFEGSGKGNNSQDRKLLKTNEKWYGITSVLCLKAVFYGFTQKFPAKMSVFSSTVALKLVLAPKHDECKPFATGQLTA